MADIPSSHLQLNFLPHEILEQIFSEPFLTYEDIVRFSSVCVTFRNVSNSSELWKKKFEQRWPHLMKYYSGHCGQKWKEEFQERHCCGIRVNQLVKEMPKKFYDVDELSQDAFTDFFCISKHKFLRHFIIDELERILYDGYPHTNLTIKYYAERVLRNIKHSYLQTKWKEFLNLPVNLQFLEKGAILFAEWCQPNVRILEDSILQEIDQITLLVKEDLEMRYPSHPVCQKGFHCSADAELLDSLWSPSECKNVLTSINAVLFQQLQFKGNAGDYHNPSNSYINKVLETKMGIPVTLCILYSAVARRLGVLCLPVSFPCHFILKWKEYPENSDEDAYTYIDVFGEGKFLSKDEWTTMVPPYWLYRNKPSYETARPIEVVHRMCWNIVDIGRQQEGRGESLSCLRNALELLNMLGTDNVEHRFLLARVYLQLNINLEEVIELLQEISAKDPSSSPAVAYMQQAAESQISASRKRLRNRMVALPKYRKKHPNVEFAVGMIMRHKKYNYTCVIYGWDPTCNARTEWMFQMGVDKLAQQDRQPFYNVLVEDGTNRYAAQENLEIALVPKAINHPNVGKYFEHFCNTHYVPNEEKSLEYPEDKPVRISYVQETHKVIGCQYCLLHNKPFISTLNHFAFTKLDCK